MCYLSCVLYNTGSSIYTILLFFQNITAMLLLRCCHRLTRVCALNTPRYSSSVTHTLQWLFAVKHTCGQLIIYKISFCGQISIIFIKLFLKCANKSNGCCCVSQAQSGTRVGIVFVASVELQQRRQRWGPKVGPTRQLETCPGRTTGWHRGRARLQPPSPEGQHRTVVE